MDDLNFFERARRRPQKAESLRPGAVPVESQNPSVSVESQQKVSPMSALDKLRASARRAAEQGAAQVDDPDDWPQEDHDLDDEDEGDNLAAATEAVQEVEGKISALRLYKDWGLAILQSKEGPWKLTGQAVMALKEGLSYKVRGPLRRHPQHGESIEVSTVEPLLTLDEAGIERYLVKHFSGVGPAKARRYLQAVQQQGGGAMEALRDVLLHRPWKLDLAAVLAGEPRIEMSEDPPPDSQTQPSGGQAQAGPVVGSADPELLARMERARQQAMAEVIKRNFMLRLGALPGFKVTMAKALANHFLPLVSSKPDPVEAAWKALLADPYEPAGKAKGYGFLTADLIGLKLLRLAPDAPVRLRAVGNWIVGEACARSGHAWLSSKEFAVAVRQLQPGLDPQKVLVESVRAEQLVVEPQAGRIYLPKLHEAEKRLAWAIAERARDFPPLTQRSYEEVVAHLKANAGKINPAFEKTGLDEAQLHAVASIVTEPCGIHVLRGGPGTGKTTIVECMAWLLRGRHFVYAAPTGKAARVLSSRLGRVGGEASTICSLLRGTDESGYEINAEKPLGADVLVIDETTMVGLQTADAILQAAQPHAHIIFLGDPGRVAQDGVQPRAGQLPSIAPGRFMHDLQTVPEVQSVELTRVFRNAGGILDVVEEVARGRLEVKDRESVRFAPLPAPKDAMSTVLARYLDLARTDGLANTVLIMPRRAGNAEEPGWNVTWANAVLRDVLNPHGAKMPGTAFRLGDRIIVRQNMSLEQPGAEDIPRSGPDLGYHQVAEKAGVLASVDEAARDPRVVNGDTGFIVGWRMDDGDSTQALPRWVRLQLDDGRRLWLPGEEVGVLDHAYALTVHAVQGSEYKNVLVCATDGMAQFMNANMLLTAFSRAKQLLEVWGDERVLKRVAATALPGRNSALPQRVAEALAQIPRKDWRQALRQESGQKWSKGGQREDGSSDAATAGKATPGADASSKQAPQKRGAHAAGQETIKARAARLIDEALARGEALTPARVAALAQRHEINAASLSFALSERLTAGQVSPSQVWDVEAQHHIGSRLDEALRRLPAGERRLKAIKESLEALGCPEVDYVQLRLALMAKMAADEQAGRDEASGIRLACAA